eukprot:EG_transcript_21513
MKWICCALLVSYFLKQFPRCSSASIDLKNFTIDDIQFKLPLISLARYESTNDGECKVFEVAVRSIERQIVYGFPRTQLFGFGSAQESLSSSSTFSWPGGIVEADQQSCTRVKWVNQLLLNTGTCRQHILDVQQDTLWANPAGPADSFGKGKEPYRGPVPVVIQVVGGVAKEESSGYPQAWYLPKCNDIPDGFTKTGKLYQYFRDKSSLEWAEGTATFEYSNPISGTFLYKDHTSGLSRYNAYAGMIGMYSVKGGPKFKDTETLELILTDGTVDPNGRLKYPSRQDGCVSNSSVGEKHIDVFG